MKRTIIPALAALALAACSEPSTADSNASAEKVEIVEPEPPAASAAPVFKWEYRVTKDEMRGTSDKFAGLTSEDNVRTHWPYDPQPMTLLVRRRATDGDNVMLIINGQFTCRSYDSDKITVKFDDGPLETFRCDESDGGSSNTVFIGPESRFIARMKASKTMMLEAPVYDVGKAQVTFKVEGLEWE